MNRFSFLIAVFVTAIWAIAIAGLAIGNATPVSLQFLAWQSIEIPLGTLLAFAGAGGLVSGAIAIAAASK
ncbi:hypothetical protein CKA32_006287 [Geitlerinema sp. FC II]|uniref:lipopolysaccharide assembly protein LapA domain-containing protein n=1 Tax=Baaleninema simplex TaxID=2862350 RepID=UPI0003468A54|nr:lipopolysaccharide assembly protein LapA domain-containing protein [Baaleninema simplex]MDC0835271.1 lipopolysaccharide assembly protein LapA domain-containing protein [Geitlerinema sp. CS-897]PPT07954.1 hypothetical protein CKA32_006287 [Geitlerinema sp. FC II]